MCVSVSVSQYSRKPLQTSLGVKCGLNTFSPQVVLERKVFNLFSSDTYLNSLFPSITTPLFCAMDVETEPGTPTQVLLFSVTLFFYYQETSISGEIHTFELTVSFLLYSATSNFLTYILTPRINMML